MLDLTYDIIVPIQTRSKLVRLSALASRFAAFMKSCPPESFIKMGGVYQELMSVEKKMDIFIDACRKEELKEAEVSREVERLVSIAPLFSSNVLLLI